MLKTSEQLQQQSVGEGSNETCIAEQRSSVRREGVSR